MFHILKFILTMFGMVCGFSWPARGSSRRC